MHRTFKYFLHHKALILTFLSISGLLFWYFRAVDGFTPRQIISLIDPKIAGEDSFQEYPSIFDQKFFYLGKGCQFYVFESADHKYVIKFLKHKHLWPSLIKSQDERIKTLFSSIRIAYTHLKEETGLIAIHLEKRKVRDKPIIIVDKLGFEHELDLNKTEFVIQKRASPSKNVLTEDKIKIILALTERCIEKGIEDQDKATVQNIGFIDDVPIFLDIGQFRFNNHLNREKEIEKRRYSLYRSLECRH